MRKLYKDVLVTTTSSLEGWQIHEYLSPVSSHIVAGTNIFSDLFASISDIFGGRSASYQKQLQKINNAAIQELQKQTINLGGNCVLAARIDHDEISGGGKSMFMVTASGTAVCAEKINENKQLRNINSNKSYLGHKDFGLLLDKQRLLKKAVEGEDHLFENDWEEIFYNQWIEFMPHFLNVIREHLNSDFDQGIWKQASNLYRMLPFDIVQNFMFETLKSETDYDMLKAVRKITSDLFLLDYEQLGLIIKSGTFTQQRNAVQMALQHKLFYDPQDIEKIKSLIKVITTSFPKRGQEKAKKTLLSSKVINIWECECGKPRLENETYCENCHKDIQGFVKEESKPADAISGLNERLKILVDYF